MNELKLKVRASDCDQYGHVNNAVYLDYLEHILALTLVSAGWTGDWNATSDYFWQISSLNIEFRQPAEFGDELLAGAWLVNYDEIAPAFGFELRLSNPGHGNESPTVVARARSEWRRLNRASGEPDQIPPENLDGVAQDGGSLPRDFSLPSDSPMFKRYKWDHNVMRSELAPSGRVHPRAILNWVEDAVFSACDQAGWPTERMLEADFLTLQTRHDSEFMSLPGADDRIRVASRLIDVRRLRGTWYHEIYDLGREELLIRDYTTGVFLNQAGRPASPQTGAVEDIQFG